MNPQPNIKITSSAIFNSHLSDLSFNHSRSLVQLAHRPSLFKKQTNNQFNQQSNRSQSQIKMENLRLVAKIMEIKTRPNKLKTQPSKTTLLRRQNTGRKRQIENENKRLGKTLLRIKLGKSLKRLRTEAYKDSSKRGQTQQDQSGLFRKEYNLFRLENEQDHHIPMKESKLAKISKLLDNGRYIK